MNPTPDEPDPRGVTDIRLGSRFATPGKRSKTTHRTRRGRRHQPIVKESDRPDLQTFRSSRFPSATPPGSMYYLGSLTWGREARPQANICDPCGVGWQLDIW